MELFGQSSKVMPGKTQAPLIGRLMSSLRRSGGSVTETLEKEFLSGEDRGTVGGTEGRMNTGKHKRGPLRKPARECGTDDESTFQLDNDPKPDTADTTPSGPSRART